MCAFPSEDQSTVINYSGRALVVVAGPGTGKTRTRVDRMSRLLIDNPRRVISFITFTRTSRRDTDAKLRQVVDKKALETAERGLPRISTLHAFAKGLVHQYAGRLGRDPDFTVIVTKQGERRILISEIIDDLGLSVDAGTLEEGVARFRSTGAWPTIPELTASQRLNVIEAFESLLKFYNTFDIEGLVLAASEILSRGVSDLPEVFLQVDEYQDLNPNDQQLVRHATSTGASQVVVVGDDAQSIYGFRHAHPAGIRELWESPDWDTVRFPECHRLPPHVLRAAHSLIESRNYLGGEADLPADDGRRLATLQCTTEDVQLRALPLHMCHLMTTLPNQSGNPQAPRDFMVLCPSNNHADRAAAALESGGLPTRRKRGGTISEEIWRLILVLRLLNNADGLALRQCLEFTPLPKARIQEIRREAARTQKSLHEHCARLEDNDIQSLIAARDRLWNSMIDPGQFRQQLLDFPFIRLEGPASDAIDDMLDYLPVVGSMVGHIYERHGVVDLDGEADDMPDEDKVLVATMHSAKGLEANVVYILWLDDRFMPAGGRDPVQEERVLYVALTRAKQDVVLMSSGRHDKAVGRYLTGQQTMSPFLHSIRGHLDIRRVTAAHLKAANPF